MGVDVECMQHFQHSRGIFNNAERREVQGVLAAPFTCSFLDADGLHPQSSCERRLE